MKVTLLSILLVTMICESLFSQIITGIIVEKESMLPIAFATVKYENQMHCNGVISDIHGAFEIHEKGISKITVSCVGFKATTIPINSETNLKNIVIQLETNTLEVNEVVVTPANNPALPIIKHVLANKQKNNFDNTDNYRYRCYAKTIIDFKVSNNATTQDSGSINLFKELKKRAALLSETVTDNSKQGSFIENKIIATKTSGLHNPLFGKETTSSFHNAISFYNNTISLFEIPISDDKSLSDYLSPLSNNCLHSYVFILDDSYANATDSSYVIRFYPKKDETFNGLKGQLFISSNGYAIRSIVVEPAEKGLIDFKFHQDYEYIKGKWFPTVLNQEIGMIGQKINRKINAYPVYLISSIIDSITYNPYVEKKAYSIDKVTLDNTTLVKSDSILNAVRSTALTVREKNCNSVMDSIGRKYHFDNKINIIENLLAMKIPIGVFDIDLYNVYNYNEYEGSRLGLGLQTNEKLFKNISLGGFSGYGHNDNAWKYGGNLTFKIVKSHAIQLRLSYQNSLKEVGMDMIDDYSKLSKSEYLRSYVANRFDKCIEEKMAFSFKAFRYLSVMSVLSLKDLKPSYEYSFRSITLTNFKADDFEVTATYSYKEELETIAQQRIINKKGNPIIRLAYKKGINLFSSKSYQYNRYEAYIDYEAYNGKIGQSNLRFETGYIDKSIPYTLLFTGEGSKSSAMPFVINNSFQTMMPYEFLSNKYVNLFFSHNFGSLLFKTTKWKPQFVVIHNSGWGMLNNANNQGIAFKEKTKVYLESGLMINNIVRANYIRMFYVGVGMGAFYRYGYYALLNINDNMVYKISVTLSLK
jgi:hypothetical protein